MIANNYWLFKKILISIRLSKIDLFVLCVSHEYKRKGTGTNMIQYEPVHEISNNVAFWHVQAQMSLYSLLLSLDTLNGGQSVA